MPTPHEQLARTRQAWAALESACITRGTGAPRVHEPGRRRAVDLWPLSQVMHAAALVARASGDPAPVQGLLDALERHRRHDAYAATVRGRERYYDDNAWVGLAALDLYRVEPRWAEVPWGLLPFLRTGEYDAGVDGVGIRWKEGLTALHACSTAPVGLLALRLHRGEPDERRRAALVALARGTRLFLQRRLTRPDGLIADHVGLDGAVESMAWSYNQGVTIALDAELSTLGEPWRLDSARELAARALRHFDRDDALWRQPPAFNGIFLRELLVLQAYDGDPRWTTVVDEYLERVWQHGRDDRGLVGAGGIGRYDAGTALDHAAIVMLLALRATSAA